MSARRTSAAGPLVAAAVALCTPSIAHAHGFIAGNGPLAVHPLTGIEHVLAMLLVGVLSAQLGGRAIWVVPTGFVGAMVVGGLLGALGSRLPFTEIGVAASVVCLGVVCAQPRRVPLAAATALAGGFGLYHGFAHGAEMPRVATPALYALGFAVTTAGLHVTGALGGLLLLCRPGGSARIRALGVLAAAAGMLLVAGAPPAPETPSRQPQSWQTERPGRAPTAGRDAQPDAG